jgi:hypothetical protein
MNRQGKFVLAAALVIMALTAGALTRVQGLQKLGQPGVRVVAESIYGQDGQVVDTNSVFLPASVLGCQSRSLPITAGELVTLPKDTTYGRRIYTAPDGFSMMTSVVLMGRDRTSLHKPEYCLPAQGGRIRKTERLTVAIAEPQPYELPVTRILFTHRGEQGGHPVEVQGVYVYWFVADGQITEAHNQRMLWMTRDLLTKGTLQRWAYVSCYAECASGGEEATFARMAGLIAAAVPKFQLAHGPPAPAGK